MGLEKVGETIGKEIVAWTRTSGKSLLTTKPVKVNTCGLRYTHELKSDIFLPTSLTKKTPREILANLDLNKCEMKINGNLVHLNKDVFFAAYYTTAAYALCKEIGLTNEQILHSLNENVLESKRLKSLTFDNRCVEMLESKNENNLSYLQSLNYINNHKEDKNCLKRCFKKLYKDIDVYDDDYYEIGKYLSKHGVSI